MSEELDDLDPVTPEKTELEDKDWLDPELPKGYLSPSQHNTYQRCPRQYEYAYIMQLVRPPGIAQIRGTAVHKGAELTHKHTIEHGKPISIEEGAAAVSDKFDAQAPTIEEWEEETQGDAKDKAIRMFRTYYNDAVPYINPVRVEHTFKWPRELCGVPVLGIIDLVDSVKNQDMSLENDPENPQMVEVVSDLKTVKRLWPASRIENEPQLTFYAIAENTDRVRIDFLAWLKTGTKYTPVTSKRGRQDKMILLEDVAEVARNIKAGIFPRCAPTGWHCSPTFCGYYSRCRGKR
jgi:hypothetical protein